MAEKKNAATSSQYLPEDLIIDIQRRLPVPCLRRLYCVNKSWYALLSNPKFVYQNLFYGDDEDTQLLIAIPDVLRERYVYTKLSYDSLLPSDVFRNLPVELPPAGKKNHLTMTSCGGGLICLLFEDYTSMVHSDFVRYHELVWSWAVWLFNPATSETKILPPLPLPLPSEYEDPPRICIGSTLMETDEEEDDDQYYHYKLVCVSQYGIRRSAGDEGVYYITKVYVFSSDDESLGWRELPAPPFNSASTSILLMEIPQYCSTKKKMCYYWMENEDNYKIDTFNLVSFDPSTDVFCLGTTLPFPSSNDKGIWLDLAIYMVKEESLVVLNGANEVWVLQQLHVAESWCKLSTASPTPGVDLSSDIIGLSKHGKMICTWSDKHIQVFDVTTDQTSTLALDAPSSSAYYRAQLTPYVPSKKSLSSRRICD